MMVLKYLGCFHWVAFYLYETPRAEKKPEKLMTWTNPWTDDLHIAMVLILQ